MIKNMSQVIMLVIQYFEFQVKLLGPMQQKLKFFTSLWKGLSGRKYVLSDYLTEIKVILKTHSWFLCSISKLSSSPHCREG